MLVSNQQSHYYLLCIFHTTSEDNMAIQALFSIFFLIFVDVKSSFIKYSQSPVYITGAVLDIGPTLPAIIGNSYIVASLFKSYSIIIYCNKTSIKTLESSGWPKNDSNVHVIEEREYPPGFTLTDRLSVARNKLVGEVKRHLERKQESLDTSFMVMMDLDGAMGRMVNRSVIKGALEKNDEWDVVSFNRERYYDIWALRYQKIDTNVWGFGKDSNALVQIVMHDITKLLAVNDGNQFFPVYSAFNGFGIYKLLVTEDCEYSGKVTDPFVVSPNGDCEHVAFHKCMRDKNNARIVIDKHFLLTSSSWLPRPKPLMTYHPLLLLGCVPLVLLVLGLRACKTCFSDENVQHGVIRKDSV